MKLIVFVNRSPHDPFVVKDIFPHLADVAEMAVVTLFDSQFWRPKKRMMADVVGAIIANQGIEPTWYDPADWNFLSECKVAVYNSGIQPVPGVKFVRIPYGQAKSHALMGGTNAAYDLICSPGPLWTKAMEQYPTAKTIETGYPKFDDWFRGTVNQEETEAVRSRLDPFKKTILYFSTWGDLSTCQHVFPQMKEVSKHYNLIVKPHDGTYYQEEWKWRPYQDASIMVLDGSVGIQPLFLLSDYVFTDISGTMFTSYLCGKKTILIDHPYKEGIGTVSTNTDQIYRDRYVRVKSSDGPEAFLHAIDFYEKNPDIKKTGMEEIQRTFFSGTDGKAGERCAEAIRRLL